MLEAKRDMAEMTVFLSRIPWSRWKFPACSKRCLAGYYRVKLSWPMVIAGLTVGLVALPLAMAFGIDSGVTPQAGLYTAVVGGFIVSALGGSRIQIGGPTGAFVVIVAGIIARHGLDGLLMVTMMSGVILLVLGLTGLGNAVKFIPRPIVIGFTNGIALLIAATQIKDFFGLKVDQVPSEFFARMQTLAAHYRTLDPATVLLALLSLGLILLVPKRAPRGARFHRRSLPRDGRSDGLASARRHHRLELRRHSLGYAVIPCSDVPPGPDSAVAALRDYRGNSGRRGESLVGRSSRFDDRGPP